jgi:hypothetical protein
MIRVVIVVLACYENRTTCGRRTTLLESDCLASQLSARDVTA